MAKKITVKEDDTTSASVPSKDVYASYIGRKINGTQDMDVLNYAMEQGLNVLLLGDTGSGKTMVGEAYASKERLYYYSLPCDVSLDSTALFGKVTPKDDGTFGWVDGPVTSIVRHGGVLNISEINYMSPRVAATLYPLLDRRRHIALTGKDGEIVHAHDDLLIIADMNPNYRGTTQINAAFKNRFPIKLRWGYDEKVESKLVNMPSLMVIASELRAKFGSELETPISTNMLTDFEKFATSFLGVQFAIDTFLTAFQDHERYAVSNVLELRAPDLEKEARNIGAIRNEDELEFIDDEDDEEFESEDNLEFEDTNVRTWNPVSSSGTTTYGNW